MTKNKVWDLIELPKRTKAINYKRVFNTKRNPLGNIDSYKARVKANGLLERKALTTSRPLQFHERTREE